MLGDQQDDQVAAGPRAGATFSGGGGAPGGFILSFFEDIKVVGPMNAGGRVP